jgi:hypothetical protein
MQNPAQAPAAKPRIPASVILGAICFVVFALRAPAFAPEPLIIWIATGAGAILAISAFAWLWRAASRHAALTPRQKILARFAAAPLIAAVAWCFATLIVLDSAAYYSLMAGTPFERQATASGWREQTRYTCAGPDYVGQSTFADGVCMDKPVPAGTLLLLRGHKTVFGFAVDTVSALP